MTVQGNISASELDHQKYLSARDSSHQDLLVHAARETGLSVFQIQRDFRQLAKSHSRLNMVEYIRFGLFRQDRFTEEERAAYISNDLHWDITHTCNNRSWSAVAEDKVLADHLLSSGGIPVPHSLAVFDNSPRSYPGLPKISTADQLRDLLASETCAVFGKIVDGMISFGAFRIEKADQTHVHCAGHAPMTYEAFVQDFLADQAYVLQREVTNHSALAPYASALGTVRMVNMVTDNGVYCPIAIIKLPQGDNIADAFWRPGNLACEVDMQTGQIKTVAERTGVEITFHEDHPATSGLMGLSLPHWDKLVAVNAEAAKLFAPIRYQSTDIAITEDGPVIIELNYGGGFDLPQYASGRGMLTSEVRRFFESHGYKFGDAARKKGWFGAKG